VVLEQGGLDLIYGFHLGSGDVLDLSQVLAQSQIDLGGDFSKLAEYFSVNTSGKDATLLFDPHGVAAGPGAALAVLNGVGANTTLNTLINDGSFMLDGSSAASQTAYGSNALLWHDIATPLLGSADSHAQMFGQAPHSPVLAASSPRG
jgi:hypothetical protein